MTTFKQLLSDMFNRLQSGAHAVTSGKGGWGPDTVLVGNFIAFGGLWIALGTTTTPETSELVLFATEKDANDHDNPLFRVYCNEGDPMEEIDVEGNRIRYQFIDLTVTHPTPVPNAITLIIREVERTLSSVQK